MNSSFLGNPSQVNTFDANDRLDSDTSDANGNTTAADGQTFTYDFENRIRSVSSAPSAVNILYDGDGNRVKKTVNGVETYYLVDTVNLTGYAQVMEELTVIASQPAVSRVYTYGLDLISQEHLHDTPTGTIWQTSFYGYDGHGNVRFLTDTDGFINDRYDFDAFGNIIAQSGSTANNYLYCGEQFDPEVGLYFLRARYMDTVRGRFWRMDVFEGRNFDPVSLHKYLYANDNPIKYLDPSGEISQLEMAVVVGLIGGLATVFSLWSLNMTAELQVPRQMRNFEQITQGTPPVDFYAPLGIVCSNALGTVRDEMYAGYIYGPVFDAMSAAFEAARLLGVARNIDEAMALPGDVKQYSTVMSNLGYKWVSKRNNCYVGGNWVRPKELMGSLPPPKHAYQQYKKIVLQASK